MNDIAMALGPLRLEDAIYSHDKRQGSTELTKEADRWASKAESSLCLPPEATEASEKNSPSPRADAEPAGVTIPSDDDASENHANLLQQKMAAMIQQRDTVSIIRYCLPARVPFMQPDQIRLLWAHSLSLSLSLPPSPCSSCLLQWENELARISSGSFRQTVETRRRKMHLERLIMNIEADVDQIRFHLRQCSSG